MTDDGAVDAGYDEALADYDQRVSDALEGVEREPFSGSIAIDLVTRQPMLVRKKVADTCREYYEREGLDLVTYKMHPWLPGISPENTVYSAVYLDGNPKNAHKPGKTYAFPSARLMHFPAEMAWGSYEVGEV